VEQASIRFVQTCAGQRIRKITGRVKQRTKGCLQPYPTPITTPILFAKKTMKFIIVYGILCLTVTVHKRSARQGVPVSRKRTETSIATEINGISLDRLNNNSLQDLKKNSSCLVCYSEHCIGERINKSIQTPSSCKKKLGEHGKPLLKPKKTELSYAVPKCCLCCLIVA
jgi:hypothetical protein